MSAFEDKLNGNWNQVKGSLKKQYASLTDDDLTYEKGQEEQLLGKIQVKTGEAKEDIKQFIDRI